MVITRHLRLGHSLKNFTNSKTYLCKLQALFPNWSFFRVSCNFHKVVGVTLERLVTEFFPVYYTNAL